MSLKQPKTFKQCFHCFVSVLLLHFICVGRYNKTNVLVLLIDLHISVNQIHCSVVEMLGLMQI